ncbi:MAG TPA: protease complex subunit PrcB family protein [Longimicrobium sp.]|nr:protease complex subunit PrcB family protein [Longimicrobium sp.]
MAPALAELCRHPDAPSSTSGRPAGYTRHELAAGDHLLGNRIAQIEQPVRCVARSQGQLAALWAEVHRGLASPAPVLNGTMVILAGMGEQASTGHAIGIDSVLVRADTALVFVTERFPGSGCTEGLLVHTPADAVQVPPAAVVRFHEHRSVAPPCVTEEDPAG